MLKDYYRFALKGMNVGTNPLLLQDGECELLKNANTDNIGSWQKRKGTRLIGNQTVSGVDILGIYEYKDSAGLTTEQFVVCDDATTPTNSDIYKTISTTLNGAITTSSESIILTDATNFATSGTIEIDGDLITYTGKTTNTLTGATGITIGHDSGATTRQWKKSLEDDTKSKTTRFKIFLDRMIRVNGTDANKAYNGSAWETSGNSTALSSGVAIGATSISVDSTTGFASAGTLYLQGDENWIEITYTGKTATTFTGIPASGDNSITEAAALGNKVYDTPLNLGNSPIFSYIEIFQDRIFGAGNSIYPDRLYASSLVSLGKTVSWSTTTNIIDKYGSRGFYFDVNPEDKYNIAGLERNGSLLLIFKDQSMYTWNGNSTQPDLLVDVGAVSQEAIITVHNITFFLGRSKKDLAIRAYTGSYPKVISRKIKKWIDAIDQSNLAKIKAGADDDHVAFYLGNITFTGDNIYGDRTFSDVWAVYTLSQDEWAIYDNLKTKAFGYFTSSGAEYLVTGNDDGKTFYFGVGTTDDSGDTKTPIEMEIITKEEHLNSPDNTFTLRELNVFSQQAQGTSVKYNYERVAEWRSLGNLQNRITELTAIEKSRPNDGRTLRLQYANATNYQSSIDGYVINVDQD